MIRRPQDILTLTLCLSVLALTLWLLSKGT